jgi:hypothetical protein
MGIKLAGFGGSTGKGCGCCATVGCHLTVNTTWCSCVAPGTITVTVHSGTITGPVVCTGTADALGKFVCVISTTGTYVVVASTSSSGYLNLPGTVVITSAPTSGNCTPATVLSELYPNQVTCTGFWGTKILLPSGSANRCSTGGGDHSYLGTVTGYSSSAGCGCGASTLNIDLAFIPCGFFGQVNPWLLFCIDNYTQQVSPFQTCPGADPLAPPQNISSSTGNLSGTGPAGSGITGFPVNLSGTYTYSFVNDPRPILYGCCASGTNNCASGCTVTQ